MTNSKKQMLTALGSLVRKRRKSLNISQEELAYRCNLDRTYISGIERGKRNPSFTIIVQLAVGCEDTVSGLLSSLEGEMQDGRDAGSP